MKNKDNASTLRNLHTNETSESTIIDDGGLSILLIYSVEETL